MNDVEYEALVDAERALTAAYDFIDNDPSDRYTNHVLVLIRIALAKVRFQLKGG